MEHKIFYHGMLQIKYVRPEALKFNSKNPRENDAAVPYLVKSISEFGFTNPILVDNEGTIIAGHTRAKAALKLGIAEVPTICLEGLSKAQIKAYMIADNKLNELAEWDNELLKELLHDLPATMDVEALGFDLDEIEKLMEKFEPNIPEDNGPQNKNDLTVVVLCENEDQQQELFIELRDRGYVVK